jgi:HSP20 family molecular chaperone IbpA
MTEKKVVKKEAKPVKPTFAPVMYMDHDDKNYYIRVELPGLKKADAELESQTRASA